MRVKLPNEQFVLHKLLDLRNSEEAKPWSYNSRTVLTEFPPSPAEVVSNHGDDWLSYVWFPRSETYPAIDFVLFIQLTYGQIIALVFQSKYSEKKASTTIGLSAGQRMYENASKIMQHAGWRRDQFEYVIHAYRGTARNLVDAPPGENTMILTRSDLLQLYGSLSATLEYAWLHKLGGRSAVGLYRPTRFALSGDPSLPPNFPLQLPRHPFPSRLPPATQTTLKRSILSPFAHIATRLSGHFPIYEAISGKPISAQQRRHALWPLGWRLTKHSKFQLRDTIPFPRNLTTSNSSLFPL